MEPNAAHVEAEARLLAALPPLGDAVTVQRALHDAGLSSVTGPAAAYRLAERGAVVLIPNRPALHALIARLS